MSLIKQLLPETLENFTDHVGNALLATLTTIRTIYADDKEEHSGTGLIVSDGMLKYVLTANHVLSPSRRVPPRQILVKRHYHTFNLRKGSEPSKPFALRDKFYRSESLDLAIIESILSDRSELDDRKDYYSIRKFENLDEFDAFNDDIFVVCGFPEAQMTEIPAAREVNHRMLIHYFSGTDGSNDPHEKDRYRFKYDGALVHPPSGLSGSPVWLLRDRNNPNKALSADYLNKKSGKELSIITIFCGIVTNYFDESKEISAVRRELCCEFVKQAMEILPTLRVKEEDEWIDAQLDYLKRR